MEPYDPLVCIFPKLKEPDNVYHRRVSVMLERIRNGEKSAAQVSIVRSIAVITAEDDVRSKSEKAKLACVLFHGQFLRGENAAMEQHSGLIILDFDKVANLVDFKAEMIAYPFVYAAWVSPSGNGLKVLIRVPANKEEHRGRFAALKKRFPAVDQSGVNESRICYESYDPNIYINQYAEILDEYEAPAVMTVERTASGVQVKKDYSKLNICAAMVRNAVPGQRHNELLKAAQLAGGYIEGGYIDEQTAINVLTHEWQSRPDADLDREHCHKQIRDGIAYGKRTPITDQTTGEYPVTKTDQTTGTIKASSVLSEIMALYETGHNKGETTRFACIDPHFTWKKGETTMISGSPNSGKTTWHNFMTLIKSVHDGWKWGVFTPESYPAPDYYIELMEILVGKPFDKDASNRMSREAVRQAAAFLDKHFFFIYPDTAHTIQEVEAEFLYNHQKYGLDGVIIDPFNQLVRDMKQQRDDQYLEDFLTGRKRFAKEHNLNYVFVTHPKQQEKNKDGNYPVVDRYDIANGAMWINKVDNFISIYRPADKEGFYSKEVEVHVKKIRKQKLVGRPDKIQVFYNPDTSRYYFNGRSPLDNIISDVYGPDDVKPEDTSPVESKSLEEPKTGQQQADSTSSIPENEKKVDYSQNFPAGASSFGDIPKKPTLNFDKPQDYPTMDDYLNT